MRTRNKIACVLFAALLIASGGALAGPVVRQGPATGTLTTVKSEGVQVGGADIVTLDFGDGLTTTENPDTEINVSLSGTIDGTTFTIDADGNPYTFTADARGLTGSSGIHQVLAAGHPALFGGADIATLTGVTISNANPSVLTKDATIDDGVAVGDAVIVNSGTNATVGTYIVASIVANTSVTLDRQAATGACTDGSVTYVNDPVLVPTTANILARQPIRISDGLATHILKAVQETGLGGRLTIGLDETARTMVICDAGDVDTDLGLAAEAAPTLNVLSSAGTTRFKIQYDLLDAGGNMIFRYGTGTWAGYAEWQMNKDLASGNSVKFGSAANIELTDTDGEQSWLNVEAKINQSGTAAYNGIKVNVLETTPGTSIGDGSTGDGNLLLNLQRESVTVAKVDRTGAASFRFETVEASADDYTLTTLECSDTLITNRGWDGADDQTFHLPDADTVVGKGLKVKILMAVTDADNSVYIDTEGSTTNIYLDGTPVGDGERVWTEFPTIGESITCHTATLDGTTYDWYCDSVNGTWADKGS